MKSARSLTTVLIVSGALAFAYCGESETQLIENPTAEEFHLGSLVYANENCSNCHGIDWDGVGAPEAASLKAAGTPVPNFLKMKDPQKTPVDYFKAMTMGTDKMPEHRYQHVTDRGRWAAAHFLFSLAPLCADRKPIREPWRSPMHSPRRAKPTPEPKPRANVAGNSVINRTANASRLPISTLCSRRPVRLRPPPGKPRRRPTEKLANKSPIQRL